MTSETRNSGFQIRIMAVALLPVLILAFLLGGTMIQQRRQDLATGLQQRGQLLARQLAAGADYGLFSGNKAALQALTDAVAKELSVTAVMITDRTGKSMATYGPPVAIEQLAVQLPSGTNVSQGTQKTQANSITFTEPVRSPRLIVDDFSDGNDKGPSPILMAQAEFPVNSEQIAGLAIVAMSTDIIQQEQTRFALTVSGLLALVLLGAFFVARSMSARLSRPVLEVAAAVQRIGRGEEGVRVQGSSIGVLNLLSKGLNETAEQLERSRQQLEHRVSEATAQLLEKKEQAERADHSKTRFLAAASHDLRQPMHALSMFITALSHVRSDQERAHLIRQAGSATAAMGNLLDALLDISKLDSGGVRANISRFPVQQVLDRIRDTFTEIASKKGLELIVRNSEAWVSSDPILLERILGNLVSNAIRYTTTHNSTTGKVLVATRLRLNHVLLQVRDNGNGIAIDSQEVIFQEFVQLANPERDRSKGLGLGLAIVKRLADLLDHSLMLRSLPNCGSTFAIELPRVATGAVIAPEMGPEILLSDSLEGVKVLVIDDDTMVRESLTHLLLLWGCQVEHAAGGIGLAQALYQRDWCPDVILCDYRLADNMDGIAVIRALRQVFGNQLPAAIVTGDTELQTLHSVGQEGIRVLYKPLRPAQLRLIIKGLRSKIV